MNELEFNQALEAALLGNLSSADAARVRVWLDDHPEFAKTWQEEILLNCALDRLPDVCLPSNFTALVLLAADKSDSVQSSRSDAGRPWWLARLWTRRLAALVVLLTILGLSWAVYRDNDARQTSHGLVWLSLAASSVPEPDLFTDFDAISRLRHVSPPSDDALFDVLTQ